MSLERRSTTATPELREAGSAKVARGYAALFNVSADIGGHFTETILPGAFRESLKSADVRALINHDSGRVIGRSSSGTLRLVEDENGLFVEIDLPDTTDGRDLAALLERGDINGMSFGFRVTHDEWDETGPVPARTIHEIKIFEVSAVAFPAYDDTTLALRSLDEARKVTRRKNFSAAASRLRMKMSLDLVTRSRSKA